MSIREVSKGGRPRKVTDELEGKVVAFLFRATLENGNMPDDSTTAQKFGISERSLRSIRLKHGLDRCQKDRRIRDPGCFDPSCSRSLEGQPNRHS